MSGAEAMYIAAAVAAAGTAAEYKGQQDKARKQRSILNQAFDEQRKTTEKSAQMLADEGAMFSGDARQQAMADQEAQAFAQTQKDLAGAGGDIVGSSTSGNVSSDFMKAKADKAVSEGNRLTAIAREAAKLRAPGQMTADEKQRQADLMGRTGSMWNSTRNMVNAGVMDAQSVQDPWYGTAGKIAKAAAMAYMMGGAGGAGAGAGAAGSTGAATTTSGTASIANFA